MGETYRIFGSDLSPYSVKVRSYFRYKRIPHEWVARHMGNMAEFQQYATLPLIPLVVTPAGTGLQDSTPIIEEMERRFPEPALQPRDPTLAFLSALIEEYADEWGNKPMFHYRWTYPPDQESAAERIARDNLPGAAAEAIRGAADGIRQRMIPRLKFVGSTPVTTEQIERSFRRQLTILEHHLAERPYLFGARPAFGDFGLFAQLYECSTDPTPSRLITASAPRTFAWIERMLAPDARGEFESWDTLAATLAPLLEDEIAALYLPWATANARALAAGEKTFSVDLEGCPFTQETQKYHAKSLTALRARYANVTDKASLDPILERTGCRSWLA